ncbi:hypothetical protein DPMN_177560 [Dreissena polymorpha]|uniref:Uncharacterized protein n=1 Tax=Dreissena polymorpha TaxID=45954 RepID=A0A9D4EBW2_DREPO|nr:hypothetical protein DPMN_177560 [Dreissena polymorpha]
MKCGISGSVSPGRGHDWGSPMDPSSSHSKSSESVNIWESDMCPLPPSSIQMNVYSTRASIGMEKNPLLLW